MSHISRILRCVGLPAATGSLLVLGGCAPGSGLSGDLQDIVSSITAPYALLDLSTGTVTWSNSVGDPTAVPAYRDRTMVFRRIGSGATECFVGIFEVTQAQWAYLDPTTPWMDISTDVVPALAQAPTRPVYGVDHGSLASALASWHPGGTARLAIPTAAQWHLAAGTNAGWTWGATATRDQLDANAWVYETMGTNQGPQPVGSLAASGQGFYDLHGNVWEWTADGGMYGGSWRDGWRSSRAEVSPGPTQGVNSEMTHALVGTRLVLIP
jgi:hypothetical protein